MQIYPTNTLINDTTQLPNSLFPDGDWEVGLAEIQYPYKWNLRFPKRIYQDLIRYFSRFEVSKSKSMNKYSELKNI